MHLNEIQNTYSQEHVQQDYFLASEPSESYLPQSEIDKVKEKKGFNGLTPTEWASLSKNVWNDLSSPRNEFQKEHGAVFPLKLSDRLIKMYSNE